MDSDPQPSEILRFFIKHWLPVSLGCVGLLLLGFGAFELFAPSEPKDIIFTAAEQASEQQQSSNKIVIDVSGAVVRPGVYTLAAGSRMQDALVAAGGMSELADRIAVAKQINLAAQLTDAAKIFIPFTGDVAAGSSEQGESQININQATAAMLEDLPGIGKVTAEKIITGRPYQKAEDLLTRKVVSQKVFEQIKVRISVF
jgi:competence protein ComEA